MICNSSNCKQKKNALKLCIHRLVVLNGLPDEEMSLVLLELERLKNNLTSSEILREQMRPEDGTKFKRRGKQMSKKNHSRAYDTIVNYSLELTDSYNECPDDIMD
ncbi:unnamed protein product [Auanema sp. JU1783]|nr:unnamed protein product [Auanema sp. JU1783]